MSAGAVTVNIRHCVGWLGKLVIFGVPLVNRVGIRVPERFIQWAIFRSSYVSVDGGP